MTSAALDVRLLVRERAKHRCEYCLIHTQDCIKAHEVSRIFPEKHGGDANNANLCFSCLTCNRFKSTDVASIDLVTGEVAPLFHPRRDQWDTHFRLAGAQIEPLTPIGRVTVRLLHLNDLERLRERAILINLGRFPRT